MNGFWKKKHKPVAEHEQTKTERIYHCYRNTMYSVALNISGNEYDAEDIVEEALIKIMKYSHRIDVEDIGGIRCKNLIITITKHTAYDWNKKFKKEIVLEESQIVQENLFKDTQEIFFEMEDYRNLIQCMDQLKEQYRDVLRLRILHGFSARETGEIMGLDEAHVNVYLMRAKKELQKILKGCEDEA